MKKWIVKPKNAPAIIRNCSRCGAGSKFLCSGNFRVNANGRNIDVWLIYKCEKCDATWNMEILSRVRPAQIERTLYQAFARNDYDTAMRYAFDAVVLSKNKASVCYDDIGYVVEKFEIQGENALEITSAFEFGLRLDKLLSEELGLSRQKVKKLIENGYIKADGAELSAKTKVRETIEIRELNLNEGENESEKDDHDHAQKAV